MWHLGLWSRSRTPLDHFLLSVDSKAQPPVEVPVRRLLGVAVVHATDMWLVNEWDQAASPDTLRGVRARFADEETAAPVSFPAEEGTAFVRLALLSRHAEVIVNDRLAFTSDDFGQYVTVELFGPPAIEAVLALAALRA